MTLAKRIISCLDVRDGRVVKGVRFRDHVDAGEIVELALKYRDAGADELVFYDITASPEGRTVARDWIARIAASLDIPFCVAGGIRTVAAAEAVLNTGADKISVNTPALENADLIDELARRFGSQCVVIGIDSVRATSGWRVRRNSGDPDRASDGGRATLDWVREVQQRGAGEIVLNAIDADGVRGGYDLEQLAAVRAQCRVPLVASGGAGVPEHFRAVFEIAGADAALAAGVFHTGAVEIPALKHFLLGNGITVRT